MDNHRRVVWTVLLVLSLVGSGVAQRWTSPQEVAEARALITRATTELGDTAYLNHPLWQDALARAEEAQRQNPTAPEPLGLIAEIYSRTSWNVPAWETWQSFLRRGGTLSTNAQQLFAKVGNQLGYGAYALKEYDTAIGYYRDVAVNAPNDLESRVWLGRIYLETGRPTLAIPSWREAVALNPNDAGNRYFLTLAQNQARWGVAAANAFDEGVRQYEAGQIDAAAAQFQRATEANPDYAEAWAWRGRMAFETQDYVRAARFYERAVGLEPSNDTYRYFATEAARRSP